MDLRGRRYVMLVNNSVTDSTLASITFPGSDVQVTTWNWDGKEVAGGAYCQAGQTRNDSGLTIRHWLAPGQEAVYRVTSALAAAEPLPEPVGRQ